MTGWEPCAQFARGWEDATLPDNECVRYLRACKYDVQPKQYDFITCPADDVGFGGARGGAKSYAIGGDWLWHDKQFGSNAVGIVFRRERVQLMEFIETAKKIFSLAEEGSGGKWKWHAIDKYFESPNGSRLRFAYLDKDSDADIYQGGNFTRVYIEERGTFSRVAPLNKMRAILRSGTGVPCQMKSTFNPGGVGHQHCKEDYKLFEKIPKGYDVFETEEGITRVFIPSKLADNRYLGADYIRSLKAACAGNEALLNAWLNGDWSVIEGAFFESWNGTHVVEPFAIPDDWLRFRTIKWASAKPFSVGWWAVAGNDLTRRCAEGQELATTIPKGALVRYREWYGAKKNQTDVGLKLEAERIAEGVIERTPRGEQIAYTVASPQVFQSDYGPTVAERMLMAGLFTMPADDFAAREIGRSGAWDQLRARLVGRDGRPAIFCFNSCADSVRTIPALQHHREKPEEIDDESELAAADDWRFACMSRPWIPVKPQPAVPDGLGFYGDENGVTHSTLTVSQIVRRLEAKRKNAEAD